MKKYQIYSIFILISFLFPTLADARRHRRSRRRKKIKLYSVRGTVSIKTTKPKGWQLLLKQIRVFHSKSNWKFRDPFLVAAPKPAYSGKLIAAVFNVKLSDKLKSDKYKPKHLNKSTIKGMGIFPPVLPVSIEDDFYIKNADAMDLKVYSPGRIINGKPMKLQTVAKDDERVFPVYPRESEPGYDSKDFWYFPLAIKNYPFAKGGVLFLKTRYFTTVNDDGSFKLSGLPPGTYKVTFIYLNKDLGSVSFTISKRGKYKPVTAKVTIPFLKFDF